MLPDQSSVLNVALSQLVSNRWEIVYMAVLIGIGVIGMLFKAPSRRTRLASGFARQRRHRKNIRKSRAALKELKFIGDQYGCADQFRYLRSRHVDPFVFEEMILTALSDSGLKVKRNHYYTGDGGIDGRVRVNGMYLYIQAKLYSGCIRESDVRDFIYLCRRDKTYGLFIHTGKTNESVMCLGKDSGVIDIISDERLISLLCGNDFDLQLHGEPVRVKRLSA